MYEINIKPTDQRVKIHNCLVITDRQNDNGFTVRVFTASNKPVKIEVDNG